MVDREILSRRLDALQGYLAELRRFQSVPETEFLADPSLHHLAERYLHLAAEAAIDCANHVIAATRLRTPENNADTFKVLQEAGVMEPDLAQRLAGWAGFRNVLVHLYLDIDHARVWRILQEELGDLDELVGWGAGWLE